MNRANGKKECSIFRDLYLNYGHDEVEAETREWMDEHISKCECCREWAENPVSIENAPSNTDIISGEIPSGDLRIVKIAKISLYLGIGFIVFFSIWLSVWLFI